MGYLPDDDGLWALRELDRVVGGDRLASSPKRLTLPEWDYLLGLHPRTLRRLRGAGWMRRGAMQPDQLADLIVPKVAEVETCDDAIEWYVGAALTAIAEARLISGRRRREWLARRNGHPSYYHYRNEQAKAAGYRSLYDMRVRRGWNDNTPDHGWRSWHDYLRSIKK